MADYDGFLVSAATANAKCSYCKKDLSKVASIRLVSDEEERYACMGCLIRIFDAVAGKKKKK